MVVVMVEEEMQALYIFLPLSHLSSPRDGWEGPDNRGGWGEAESPDTSESEMEGVWSGGEGLEDHEEKMLGSPSVRPSAPT